MWKLVLPFVLCIMGSVAYQSQIPDYSDRLEKVLTSVKSYLAQQKPDWKHRAIEPIQGSRNVLVNNWELDDQAGVRVSFMAFGEKAAEARAASLSKIRPEKRLPELGDGGYSFGYMDASICFWKEDIEVCVSSATAKPEDAKKTTDEFVKLILAAIPAR
jgi:hypothetical protein